MDETYSLFNIKYGDMYFIDMESGEPTELAACLVEDENGTFINGALFAGNSGEQVITFIFITNDGASHNVDVKFNVKA